MRNLVIGLILAVSVGVDPAFGQHAALPIGARIKVHAPGTSAGWRLSGTAARYRSE
jgi:hypothetical protein